MSKTKLSPKRKRRVPKLDQPSLDALRFSLHEGFSILKFSPALGYKRIAAGELRTQKDGGRTYITREELTRYIQSRNQKTSTTGTPGNARTPGKKLSSGSAAVTS